jgi:hypothetical protein
MQILPSKTPSIPNEAKNPNQKRKEKKYQTNRTPVPL